MGYPVLFSSQITTAGNYGYFTHSFSPEACRRFFLIAPAIKGTVASALIITFRLISLKRSDSGYDIPGHSRYQVRCVILTVK